MQRIACFTLGCLALAVAPPTRAGESASDWRPTPAQLAKLAPETKVEGWSLRPPIG